MSDHERQPTWEPSSVADAIEAFLNEPEEMVEVRAIDLLAVLRALDAAPTRLESEELVLAEPLTYRPGELAARVMLYLQLHGTAGDPMVDEHKGRVSDDEVLG